jgi:hypothetical protein
MATNIVLIHIGSVFPQHINDCVALLSRQKINIHIILEASLHQNITNKKIQIIDINSLIDIRYNNYDIINYDSKFRDSFYRKSSARFIIIDNYVKATGLENFFHIENDIALFSDLNSIQQYLCSSSYDTCLVIDNHWRCVPSIVWYKNSAATSRLSNFIYNNNNLDDMKNLAIYFHLNRNKITNFPIVPFDLFDNQYNINYGNMYTHMLSIFDGAAIGQYLYGIDKNNNKNDTKGFINEACVVDFSKFQIQTKPSPHLIIENKRVPINNLHMHCKNIFQLL